MKELNDLDLGGAPYGYTPFCESRPDMDGYRYFTLFFPQFFIKVEII